jgi:hypothetical protein
MQCELGREIRNGAAGELRTLTLAPGAAGRPRGVEARQGPMVVRQPFWVGDGARQRLRRNELEHPNRVVRRETPQWVVEAPEYVAGVRVPAPPEVVCELVEPVDVTRKLRHRLLPTAYC